MIDWILAAAALLGVQEPNCADPQTQADMNQCAARSAREADADLNLIYATTVAEYERMDRESESNEGVKRLRAAHRAWIAYRDAECAVAGYEALGGSMESMLVSGCIADLTKRRANELRSILASR